MNDTRSDQHEDAEQVSMENRLQRCPLVLDGAKLPSPNTLDGSSGGDTSAPIGKVVQGGEEHTTGATVGDGSTADENSPKEVGGPSNPSSCGAGSMENASDGSEGIPKDLHDLLNESWRMTEAAIQSSDIKKLREAIVFAEKAAARCSAYPVLHSNALDSLGEVHLAMYQESREPEHLKRAVEAQEESVSVCPPNYSDRPCLLGNLASSLSTRFQTSADIKDLDRSIAMSEETLELASPSERPLTLWRLGGSLRTRFENTANMSDLERSVMLLQEAVAPSKLGEDRCASLNNLANSLRTRYLQTRNVGDLNDSIVLRETVLALCSVNNVIHVDRAKYLKNLAVSLTDRFRLGKHNADLDEVVILRIESLILTPPTHVDRSAHLLDLATSIDDRFDLKHDTPDLELCIILREQALGFCPTTHINRHNYLVDLARSFSKRFKRKHDIADLDRAI
ncbi:hypothetical protein FRB99_004844 [Tulasnella sp. 403]|nr:hypothetical protein FRB99_004844 [Tulasnella sp. 403]